MKYGFLEDDDNDLLYVKGNADVYVSDSYFVHGTSNMFIKSWPILIAHENLTFLIPGKVSSQSAAKYRVTFQVLPQSKDFSMNMAAGRKDL